MLTVNEFRRLFGIPQVEIEVVDKAHLPTAVHVRMRRMLLALGLRRPPHRGLFLRDTDQHYRPVTAVAFGGLDQRPRDLLLVSPLANRRTGIEFFFAHRYTSAT